MNKTYIFGLIFGCLFDNNVQGMEEKRDPLLSCARNALPKAISADERIETILQSNGNDVNDLVEVDGEHYTLLSYAVQSGSLPAVRRLLDDGAEIRLSPGILSLALSRGNQEILKELLSRELSAHEIEDATEHARRLQAGIDLVRNHQNRIQPRVRHRPTIQRADSALLAILAKKGDPDALLEAEAIEAGNAGDTERLSSLLRGLDLKVIQRIFDYHRSEWPIETLELLTQTGARANLNFSFAWANLQLERLIFFLENGGRAEINRELEGRTPLLNAVMNGGAPAHIRLLLSNGAIADGGSGIPPKQWAMRRLETLYRRVESGNDSESTQEEIVNLKIIIQLLSPEEPEANAQVSWRRSVPLRAFDSLPNLRSFSDTIL